MSTIRGILERLGPISRGMSMRAVLTADRISALQEAIHALASGDNLVLGAGLRKGYGQGGVRLDWRGRAKKGGAGTTVKCPFGELITIPAEGEIPAKRAIRGGTLVAGDKNWKPAPHPLNLEIAGEWNVWLEVGVTARNIDGVLFPGLLTSTEPVWSKGAVDDGYPDTIQPDPESFEGTAIVMLGKLTIADGKAVFENVRCGNIVLGYCDGNVSVN